MALKWTRIAGRPFNWAVKRRFFLRGGGGCTHPGYKSSSNFFSRARSPSGRCFFMCSAEKASEKAKASRWGQLPELKMISDGLRENLLQAGKTVAFDFSPWSRVDHALLPIFMLWLVKIDRWFRAERKICAAFWNLFTLTAEGDRVFVSSCDVFNCELWAISLSRVHLWK